MEREAQQDRWDAENAAIERKEKADKHAKALSISDETVMNFPIKDVNASCRTDDDQRVVNACLDRIQHYYTIGKILWNQMSLDERKVCLSMAVQYTHAAHFYGFLKSCLQNKKQEADMLRPRTFNW
jgi:hypothetical protein